MAGVTKVWTGAAEYCVCGEICCDAAAATEGTVAWTCWMSWIVGTSEEPGWERLRELLGGWAPVTGADWLGGVPNEEFH